MNQQAPMSAMQQEISDAVSRANAPLLERIAQLEQMLTRHFDQADDRFLTVEQAAKILHLNPATVRKKCSSGEIPFTRPGRKILIDRNDIQSI